MQTKTYSVVMLFLLVVLLLSFNYLSKSSSEKVLAQQDDDSPLTEEQLITRFANIINQEVPALKFKIENDGAGEIKTLLINAARDFISANDFTAAKKTEADNNIRIFAQRLTENSLKAGTAKVDERKLITIEPASPEIPTIPVNDNSNINSNVDVLENNINNNSNVGNVFNVNQNTGVNTNTNQNINSNINVNGNFSVRFKNSRFNKSLRLNSFLPQRDDPESQDFERKKITKAVVANTQRGLCPLAPICR